MLLLHDPRVVEELEAFNSFWDATGMGREGVHNSECRLSIPFGMLLRLYSGRSGWNLWAFNSFWDATSFLLRVGGMPEIAFNSFWDATCLRLGYDLQYVPFQFLLGCYRATRSPAGAGG